MGRVEFKRGAIEEILMSEAVEADLLRRAKAIAQAAGRGFEADSFLGSRRVRASVRTVTPEAMRSEADDLTLTRSIDAGRP